jgi:DNA-binding MarR family transcriptional regulator
MSSDRKKLLEQLWDAQDEAYGLMTEYDSLPHHYGEAVLYQAEAYIINLIGQHPDITITALGNILKKTPSACSQIVKKLREKGWVEQIRNQDNNRQYNLRLTESGQKVYQDHVDFNRECQKVTFEMLSAFSDEELKQHIAIQRCINQAYLGDVRRSRERSSAPEPA